MGVNRRYLGWGVFLIAFGGIPLAVDNGWIDQALAADLGQLWPLILVGIGLGLILRYTPLAWFGGALVAATFGLLLGAAVVSVRDDAFSDVQSVLPAVLSGNCAGDDIGTTTSSQDGVVTGDAFALDVDLWCGDIRVTRGATETWAVLARTDAADPPRIEVAESSAGTTTVRLAPAKEEDIVFLGRATKSRWDVQAPAEPALRFSGTLNAATGLIDAGTGPVESLDGTWNGADVVADLSGASVPQTARVDLTLNASDGRLLLPNGSVDASVTLNASSLTMCVPEAAPLVLTYESVLGAADLGSAGLTEVTGGRWVTPGFADELEHVSLRVTNTASSFSLQRPEACS